MDKQHQNKDLGEIETRLSKSESGALWRSLDELAGSPELDEYLHREFPRQAAPLGDMVNRRQFLKLMGASLALAGLAGCHRKPQGKIVPFVKAPEEILPGQPLYYATAVTLGGYALGVLGEVHEGRPTKLEGNPMHPASLGSTDAITQAELLNLYDPDRSQSAMKFGRIDRWETFIAEARTELMRQQANQGAGLRILTGNITSPTFISLMQTLLKQFPQAKWIQYEPVNRDGVYEGTRLALGQPLNPVYDLKQAKVIVSLDSDFLYMGPGSVRYARDFADGRRIRKGSREMNRLYAAESMPSVTGSMADNRLRAKPSQILALALALAKAVGVQVDTPWTGGELSPEQQKWAEAAASDLKAHAANGLVIAGDHQPAAVHAIAHAINAALGSAAVSYTQPAESQTSSQNEQLRMLAQEMEQGKIGMLLILGANPVLTAPADLNFGQLMPKVAFTAQLGRYVDETARLCVWHLPEMHPFEHWSDARAYDGTVSIIQPLIGPLYPVTKSSYDLVGTLAGQAKPSYDLVREYWLGRKLVPAAQFDVFWQQCVHDGVIPNTQLPTRSVSNTVGSLKLPANSYPALKAEGYELMFLPDPTIYDGRFANNSWLQELPKPISKITWDNVIYMSPSTYRKLGLHENRDGYGRMDKWNIGRDRAELIEVDLGGRKIKGAAWPLPGHADDVFTLHLGYGRRHAGNVGNGYGFDAYSIRTFGGVHLAGGAQVSKTGETTQIACTEMHHLIDTHNLTLDSTQGRPVLKHGTLASFLKDPEVHTEGFHGHHPETSMYPSYEYGTYENPENYRYSWAMVIDPNVCTGCNACVVACQAENNIPVVSKEQVIKGREMHWIRIDRYYKGSADNPEMFQMPVTCMQCEKAPCEVVCPVAATVHSKEGLNQMVYNRCVGTRYCSNNCPYKVRRFNFFKYADYDTPVLKLLNNPNVTVRGRGVMEKCTYCVQRINAARINAKKENRRIRDGEIVTACQQACPTQAIMFGDLNDKDSKVNQWREQPHHFALFEELNTRPRTTYLAKLTNPNSELKPEETTDHAGEH